MSRAEKARIKKGYGIPSVFKAIRDNCLECCAGSPGEVAKCACDTNCPLWPFRFGRNPNPKDLIVRKWEWSEKDQKDVVVEEYEYKGYPKRQKDE
jgi:hypothetical protein